MADKASPIQQDLSLDFTGLTEECSMCTDGKQYNYTERCPECKGKARILKGTRRYKCKKCEGNGYVMLKERTEAGPCAHCSGTRKVPLTLYSQVTAEDKEWIYQNLFNFDRPYDGKSSSFNEDYLGMGIVCGVTDYGRHTEMSPEEFKQEVHKRFTEGWLQYITLCRRDKSAVHDGAYLPKQVLIRRHQSGWHAYPVYQEKS